MRRAVFVPSVAVAIVAVVGTACGSSGGSSSSSKSQQDTVCSDAGTLQASIDTLVNDVKSGNFGNAKDQVKKVESDFRSLQSSAKSLAASKKQDVQSDVDTVKQTLDGLQSANSLSDIQGTLTTAKTQIKDSVDSLTKTLKC
jgi:outer membrane murein-binding lipoprotein Lpp